MILKQFYLFLHVVLLKLQLLDNSLFSIDSVQVLFYFPFVKGQLQRNRRPELIDLPVLLQLVCLSTPQQLVFVPEGLQLSVSISFTLLNPQPDFLDLTFFSLQFQSFIFYGSFEFVHFEGDRLHLPFTLS